MNFKDLQMKRALSAALLVLLLDVLGMTQGYAQPTGAINGLFSIAEGRQVYFSRGNLQYQASSNTWRFATNQYDIIGSDNVNISPTYSGWIDLFGWGTSGNNHGAVCYQPWSTSTNSTDYYAYGDISYNLNDQTGQADWGSNPISNGGNTTNEWRTLSLLDLYYIVGQRNTSSGIFFAKATVANVKGLILLPDNWDASCFYLSNVNQYDASCSSNVISASQWLTLENAGAVFLPVGGFRIGNVYHEYNDDYFFYGGQYWLSTRENNNVSDFLVHEKLLYFYYGSGYEGYFVRLINDSGPSSFTINATPNPSSGGVVTGSGVYAFNATCTLMATANPGYHFVKWQKDDGSFVSSSSTYTFSVRESANYVAIFDENLPFEITVSANPSSGGTVSGGGTYYYGDTCTVSAVANSGYTFENWTRNGNKVSTAASYSFVVTEARNLVANFTPTSGNGMLNGVFSVGNNSTVVFSKGNLQYQASTNVWRFATHQYDAIGGENANAAPDYTGWIDLFAWGTSGYNHGAICYQPWNTSGHNSDFYAYGSLSYNLGDQTGQADWGYNAICNGGNATNTWRTLTSEEWEYLFNYRTTSSGILFVKARVNGVSGIVLLPDNWNASTYNLIGINGYEVNTISESDWINILEMNGAVFLPDMLHRLGTEISPHMTFGSTYGKYWSATHAGDEADLLYYTNDGYPPSCGSAYRGVAFGVRLVQGSGSTSYIINAMPNPSDGGTVNGSGGYPQGSTCTLTAVANSGYSFTNWTENGNQVSTNASYTFTVTGNRTLMANFTANPVNYDINVSANPSNGGTVNGGGSYQEGYNCTVTAAANSGYTFTNWTENGNVVSTNASYMFTVTGNRNLVANFEEITQYIQFDLNDSYGDGWTGNYLVVGYGDRVSEQLTISSGSSASYMLQIPNGSHVTLTWIMGSYPSDCSFTVSYPNGNVIYMGANMNASFIFEFDVDYDGMPTSSFGITVSANPSAGGSVNGAGNFNCGSSCTVTATANSGYTFSNWSENGNQVSTNASYTFTVTGDRTLVANFTANPANYTIGVSANPSNGGTVSGGGSYQEGSDCTVTATANSDYTFSNWTENGNQVSTNASYAFTVTGDRTLVANFTANPVNYTIGVSANPSNGGTVSGGGSYQESSSCTVTATANSDYTFTSWTENGTVVSASASYTFTVSGDRTLVANFVFSGNSSHEYVDLGLPSGTLWATCNVGANAPELYGDYFAWGETQPKDTYDWSTCQYCMGSYNTLTKYCNDANYGYNGFTDDLTVLLPEDDAATANWGEGWRMPTEEEFEELCNNTTVTWTTQNGVNGRRFTASNGNSLFLPAAGYRSGTSLYNAGTLGNYWSSSLYTVFPGRTLSFHFRSDVYCMIVAFRYEGQSIRPVRSSLQSLSLITVAPNPPEGGEVSGGGTYPEGAACTLTATANEGYTFTNWTENDTVVSTSASYTFTVTGDRTLVANFTVTSTSITQTTNLDEGWNWWSCYVELSDIDGLGQMEESLGDNGIMIKSRNDGFIVNSYGMWLGQLSTVNNESTYFIQTSAACDMTVTGNAATPSAHPITLSPGWNWIGYPCTTPMSVSDAMSGLTPMADDLLKSRESFAVYTPGIGWLGTLSTITPGMGLMFESHNTSSVTLTYPNSSKSGALLENITAKDNHWEPEMQGYAQNMNVMAIIELDGEELEGGQYELAAFSNGECRGSAKLMYVEPIHKYMAFLTVYGEGGEELGFGLYDAMTGAETYDSGESLVFEANAVVGAVAVPFVVRFGGMTGMDEFGRHIHLFPNPVGRGENVSLGIAAEDFGEVQIEVINALGAVVSMETSTKQPVSIKAPDVAGAYTLRITVKGKGTCYRKLVVR